MIKITHFQRKPYGPTYSIERLFSDVRSRSPGDMQIGLHVCKYVSQGLLKRVYNIVEASFHQGDVNHVTGDVHFLTFLLRRKRTVLTILDCVMMEKLHGLRRFVFWLFWLWLPAKRSAVITVISAATRQQVLNYLGCDPGKVKVIYCHVSDEFKPSPQLFNRNCPRLLQVGATPNKNIERLAAALAGLDCKLVIVGELSDAQKQALLEHKVDYENLLALSREALLEQYARCDMLLFASLYEGFGLPIVEGNAVGRPVVTSNIWSMPEVAGDAACLVNPFDVADIRAGILRIMEDAAYREKLVANGFENVRRFKLDNIAAQYAELYREIYKGKNRCAASQE